MPIFDSNPLENLAFDNQDADETVDLRGLARNDACARVSDLINNAPPGRRYLLRFTAATGDGCETLFQPLGRQLLAARRAGRLASCLPAADGAGYLIAISRD